jgi:hypothetical protein
VGRARVNKLGERFDADGLHVEAKHEANCIENIGLSCKMLSFENEYVKFLMGSNLLHWAQRCWRKC